MQPAQLGVDVDALGGVGTEVAAAATTLRDTVRTAGTGLAPPAGSGSAAAVAAQAAEQAWLADLRRLTAQVEAFGTHLTEAARDYRATDQAGADGLRRGGSQVPR